MLKGFKWFADGLNDWICHMLCGVHIVITVNETKLHIKADEQ